MAREGLENGLNTDTGLLASLARDCGFELVGVAPADPLPEVSYYMEWVRQGMAAEMSYLTGRRANLRLDPKRLLPSARSIICVGKLYNSPEPSFAALSEEELGRISRYAWGEDYHRVLRRGLKRLAGRLRDALRAGFDWKICVDTAPLLERAYARRAGLGWIGKNSCLINQRQGSWFFLGELLTSVELEPGAPPADRCGSCARCVDACPTGAIVPAAGGDGPPYAVDARLCVSYLTIELRGAVPSELRNKVGNRVFGCDVCQEVCPWNRRAPVSREPAFAAARFAPPLEELASVSEKEFLGLFRDSPVSRATHRGLLRNTAVVMGNSRLRKFRRPLRRLARFPDPLVAEHAAWALRELE